MTADIDAQDVGTLWIVSSETDAGQDWLEQNLQAETLRWAGGFVVEPRYVGPILEGACAAGLEVST